MKITNAQENIGLFWVSGAIENKNVLKASDPKNKNEIKIKSKFKENVILIGKIQF